MDKNTAVIYIPKKLKDKLKKLAKEKGYTLQVLSVIILNGYINNHHAKILKKEKQKPITNYYGEKL